MLKIALIGNQPLLADWLPLDAAAGVKIEDAEEEFLVLKVVGSVKEEVGLAATGNNDPGGCHDCGETTSITEFDLNFY